MLAKEYVFAPGGSINIEVLGLLHSFFLFSEPLV